MTTKAKLGAVSLATRAVVTMGNYGVQAAQFCLASLAASKAQEDALANVNALVVTMREAGVTKVGRNSKKNGCPIAIDFHAALVTGGIKATTANNYLTTFKQAVESGKPITEWNASRANEKAKALKASKQPRDNPARDALIKLLNTAGGVELLHALGVAFEESDNHEETLVDVAIDYLASEGEEGIAE
jgi:hypothetical protein